MDAVAGASLRHVLAAALLQAGFTRAAYDDDNDDDYTVEGEDREEEREEKNAAKRRKEEENEGAAALPPSIDPSRRVLTTADTCGDDVGIRPSPLLQMAAAVESFICRMAKESKRLCESSNRTRANEIDVACAYTRLGKTVAAQEGRKRSTALI
jgi:hypothetical protein